MNETGIAMGTQYEGDLSLEDLVRDAKGQKPMEALGIPVLEAIEVEPTEHKRRKRQWKNEAN